VQAVEEAAAKTTIKLIFPLVLFIFPSLFLVALGPAILSIMASFKTMNH
jgi:tight adherence protein C